MFDIFTIKLGSVIVHVTTPLDVEESKALQIWWPAHLKCWPNGESHLFFSNTRKLLSFRVALETHGVPQLPSIRNIRV